MQPEGVVDGRRGGTVEFTSRSATRCGRCDWGMTFRLGKLPISASIEAFDNVETPQYGADWTLRLQVQFLSPK
jgi:hypothetical protein